MKYFSKFSTFCLGITVGALLSVAGTAIADSINMVGKSIDGQFPVSVDGVTLENPAIVVDGTSFLPVREFGETVGYAVYFDSEGAVKLEIALSRAELQARADALGKQAALEEAQMQAETKAKNDREAEATRIADKSKQDDRKAQRIQENISETKQRILRDMKSFVDVGGDPAIYETALSYQKSVERINQYKADLVALSSAQPKTVEQLENEIATLKQLFEDVKQAQLVWKGPSYNYTYVDVEDSPMATIFNGFITELQAQLAAQQ